MRCEHVVDENVTVWWICMTMVFRSVLGNNGRISLKAGKPFWPIVFLFCSEIKPRTQFPFLLKFCKEKCGLLLVMNLKVVFFFINDHKFTFYSVCVPLYVWAETHFQLIDFGIMGLYPMWSIFMNMFMGYDQMLEDHRRGQLVFSTLSFGLEETAQTQLKSI